MQKPMRLAWLCRAVILALALHPLVAGAATGRFEVPRRALPGRALVRISFASEGGAPLTERVAFELAVTGRARFATVARSGTLLGGGGSPFISGESDSGLFEVDVDIPVAEAIEFLFQETTAILDGPITQAIFSDTADGPRPLWLFRPLGGRPPAWSIADVESGNGRTRAWWSGAPVPSADGAIVSIPLAIPSRGKTFLDLRHRYGLEGGQCPPGGPVRHAARVEVESSTGEWSPLEPEGGYPDRVGGGCPGPLDGQAGFGGSTAGTFIVSTFDTRTLAGRRARIRLRLAAGCEECAPPADGWFVDAVDLVTTVLSLEVLDPAGDLDQDGVSNEVELARASDPRQPDTDGDGLPDGVEDLGGVFEGPGRAGTDPFSPDTDAGGISDGVEVGLGTDPNDPLEEPLVRSLPSAIPVGPGRSWVIGADGTAGASGADPIREVFAGAGGFRLSAGAADFPPVGEAFDDDGTGERLTLPVTKLGPFLVTRRIAGSRDRRAIRYLETFENPSSNRLDASFQIECEFAQKTWVEIESTASGDDQWNAGDGHVHFNDRDPEDGMPYLLWLHGEPGARAELTPDGLTDGKARVAGRVVLEPGEKKSFLHVAVLSDSLEASRDVARDLLEEIAAGTGVPRDADAHIVNFSIDRDRDGLPAWFEEQAGLDPGDPADAAADPDGDGLANIDEYRAGSDPRLPDTDGDGLDDRREVKDLATDPRSPDSDGDGIDDASDPSPASAIIAAIVAPRHAFQGATASIQVDLREAGAAPVRPIRFRLVGEGDGTAFQGPVTGGVIVDGIGTSSILVEARGGTFGVDLTAPSPGSRRIRIEDSERQGIVVPAQIDEDFEQSDGDFADEGARKAWQWGAPAGAPGAASGSKVWGVGLSGSYPSSASAWLTSPEHRLAAEGTPLLTFSTFLEAEENFDEAMIWIIPGNGPPELLAGPLQNTGPAYERISFNLSRYKGQPIRIQFAFEADDSIELQGWYVDDLLLEGIETGATVEFIDPAGDLDRDGIDNRTEVARGTDLASADSDADGLGDGVESGTGVFVDAADTGTDPTRADTDGGGEIDGGEVSRGSNPHDPADDEIPVLFDQPDGTVPLTDGGGNEWQGTPLGAALLELEEFIFMLDLLFLNDFDGFAAFEGKLTQGGRELVLESTLGFEGPPHIRKLFSSRDAPLLRWLDVFQNPGTAPLTTSFEWQSIAAGQKPPEVVETSSGDRILDPGDRSYIILFESGEKKLYLGRAIRGEGAAHPPRAVMLGVPFITEAHALTVPAGERVGILRFASLSPSLDEVRETLAMAGRLDPAAIDGMSEEDLSIVSNFSIDLDDDGLPDRYEIENGLDPRNPADAAGDADQDGLAALEERNLGTDPRKADTDGDSIPDREEGLQGTNPLLDDTDGDGVLDGADSFPLRRLFFRFRAQTSAITGDVTRWRLRVELADRTSLQDAGISSDALLISIQFGPPIEVVRVVTGEMAGERDGAHLFRPSDGWLVLDLRANADGPVVATLSDAGSSGVPTENAFLRFIAADSDPDQDGLSSAFEVDRGSDPFSPDTDADGIPDRFETGSGVVFPPLDFGTPPWTPDADGGGARDRDEILAGLDPLDPLDDLVEHPLPIDLRGAAGAWKVLPSWALTGSLLGSMFDNAGTIRLNGVPLPPLAVAGEPPGGGSLQLGPAISGGLEVSRSIRASAGAPFVRFVEAFRNMGPTSIEARVEIGFDAAGDLVNVVATSSREAVLDTSDGWVILKDRGAHILHVFFGGPRLRSVEVVAPDILREEFVFDVPPGETRSLIHFIGTGSLGAMQTLARTIAFLDGGALEGVPSGIFRGAVNLPPLRPIAWDRFPRSAVAPGDLIVIAGEFFDDGIEVRLGLAPCEPFARHPDHIVVRAPAIAPGPSTLEVAARGGVVFLRESLEVGPGAGRFRRGDADGNEIIDLADAVMILRHLFGGGEPPSCLDSADTDDSGAIDLTDSIHLLGLLFQGLGALPYPGGVVPGIDPAPDLLDCP